MDDALTAVLTAAEEVFAKPVAPSDNFFDLDGTSLLAIRLIALVKSRGHRLHVEDVFDQPDMRALADSAVPTA